MLADAIHLIQAQTWETFLYMFWFVIFFEFPRFVLGGVTAVWSILKMFSTRHKHYAHSQHYQVSVLIPMHNNGSHIKRTVISLSEQVNIQCQVIVINDGSNDGSDMICKQLLAQGMIHEYIVLTTRGGKASALNAGLARVKYPLVISTDADTTFDRDALFEACQYFSDPKVGAVCGNLRVANTNVSLATKMQQINYIFGITLARMVKDILGFYFVISGAFGVYRTHAIKQVGGWNYGPGDDGDMSTQIRLAGWDVRFAIFSTAMTNVPKTFSHLGRQRLRWNRSMIRVRFRKYRGAVISTRNKTFKFFRALSFLETYLTQGFLPFLFIYYVVGLIASYGVFTIAILLAIHIFYSLAQLIEYLIYLSISTEPKQDLKLIFYLPLYAFFHSYFLRFIALYATINELTRRGSYQDEFYPKKVRDNVDKY